MSSLSEYNNKLNEENNIPEKSNYIENISKDAVRNIANEKFTPDEMLDYVNNCLKVTSISLYQLAHYFSLI